MPDFVFETIPDHIDYPAMLERQHAQRKAVAAGDAQNTIYFLEHEPTITMGRNSHEENLLFSRDALEGKGVTVHETDRGGDVTYHGPGQLVIYPILNLEQWRCSVGWYLRSLEEVVIKTLATWDLQGERVEGYTGVWVDGAKVSAVGVGVNRWVTFHGTSINVDPDMTHFQLIVPCGITDKPVTTLKALLGGSAPSMEEVRTRYEQAFREVFTNSPE